MKKKILVGNLSLPYGLLETIKDCGETFKNIIISELPNCDFDIYEADYDNESIICISFSIASNTFKQAEADYSFFKKIIKDTFGMSAKQILLLKKERI